MRGLAVVFAALAVLVLVGPARGAEPLRDFGPVFSPDGHTIAFVRMTPTSDSLMLIQSDGRQLRTLVPNASARYLTWSPDSRSLAYASQRNIWRVDVATGVTEQLTHDSGINEDWQPSWSPDGTLIAYDRFERCFRCTGVWVMNADGSNQHELLQNGRRPTWSPDGTALALSLAPALVIDPSGEVVLPGGGAYTAWSPRGVCVATEDRGLRLYDVATGASRVLTHAIVAKPAWSLDGAKIAGEGDGLHVTIVRARTGALVKRFAASNTGGGGPTWSPAGLVAFAHTSSCGIDVAREDGTHQRRLTHVC
jgi:dipeptidyl aminopeptidase/acylaminoacyl peptidase